MLVDGGIGNDLSKVAAEAQDREAKGYSGAWGSETSREPFLPLVIGAEHTSKLELGTAIAVAFARSPMTTANAAWDLNEFSQGRMMLGLGSQIKPHIEKRFSMPWSHPAPRMKEFISAMRAIWDCWQNGTKLNFRGDFYSHTLMTPFFDPGPNPYGAPKVFLAAVGETMSRVAGEVADGMLIHGFSTRPYIDQVTLPAIEAGLAASGRTRADFQLSYPIFVVTGDTEEQFAKAKEGTCRQIAFYGSTPAYKGVLATHGWEDLQPRLNTLSKQGKWEEMGELIDDEVLDAFAVVGEPNEIAAKIKERVGGVVDRVSFYARYNLAPETADRIRSELMAD